MIDWNYLDTVEVWRSSRHGPTIAKQPRPNCPEIKFNASEKIGGHPAAPDIVNTDIRDVHDSWVGVPLSEQEAHDLAFRRGFEPRYAHGASSQ